MNDTIVAIGTALQQGAINIIRISGSDSLSILKKMFSRKIKFESHKMYYGYILDKNKSVIDEVMAVYFKENKSYTTEPSVEIYCHGGVHNTRTILQLCLRNGARLAENGEFTKRAFLNGRIDLLQAEGIEQIITAKSDSEIKIALNSLLGNSSTVINDIRDSFLEIIANIEVNIDYPEYEDAIEMTNDLLFNKLNEIKITVTNILERSKQGSLVTEGIKTVIIGKPNVGKSSLLNALIDENKAIVTDIPGTTRDVVEGILNVEGVTLKLLDTAGIHYTDDIIEKLGIDKSIDLIKQADLVLHVIDDSKKIDEDDTNLLKLTANSNRIIILNKSDIANVNGDIEGIKVSAITSDVKKIVEKIKEIFFLNQIDYQNILLVNNRHMAIIEKLVDSIDNVLEATKQGIPIDLVVTDVYEGYSCINQLLGKEYSDDIINELFSKFCLGK